MGVRQRPGGAGGGKEPAGLCGVGAWGSGQGSSRSL